jgi:hypothetical protein
VGAKELGPAATPGARVHDDRVLVADHLAWRARQAGPTASILWLAGAHHPYRGVETPFGEATLRDRYDNCVRCSDDAVGRLVDGLVAQGRFESTLILVLGDHGEAPGEHLDAFHDNAFYDHSVRIPCLLVHPRLFAPGRRCGVRFGVRDLAATLFWLLGDERPLHHSRVLFSNSQSEPLPMSNIYQDFKLGLLEGDRKWTFRPERGELVLHDLATDPTESNDLAATLDPSGRDDIERRLVAWWHAQRRFIDETLLEFVITKREAELELAFEPPAPRAGDPAQLVVRGADPGLDVELVIVVESSGGSGRLQRTAVSDADGLATFSFSADDLQAGTYLLRATQRRTGDRGARSEKLRVTIAESP